MQGMPNSGIFGIDPFCLSHWFCFSRNTESGFMFFVWFFNVCLHQQQVTLNCKMWQMAARFEYKWILSRFCNGEILTQFEGFLDLLSVLLRVINSGGRESQNKHYNRLVMYVSRLTRDQDQFHLRSQVVTNDKFHQAEDLKQCRPGTFHNIRGSSRAYLRLRRTVVGGRGTGLWWVEDGETVLSQYGTTPHHTIIICRSSGPPWYSVQTTTTKIPSLIFQPNIWYLVILLANSS